MSLKKFVARASREIKHGFKHDPTAPDEDACCNFFTGIIHVVENTAARISKESGVEQEDLVQEGLLAAYLSVFRHSERKHIGDVQAYAHINAWERMQNCADRFADPIVGAVSVEGVSIADARTSIDSMIAIKLDSERALAALELLPESQREILRLRYIVGLSLEKVGKMFGISRQRIHQKETRALKMLRQQFA